MSAADAFLDTNILLYLLSDDAQKAAQAESLLTAGGTISVQVLNEFATVATRRAGLALPEVCEVLATVRALCTVRPVELPTHERGLAIAERFGFSIYDSMIVAAAVLSGCKLLYSEDLQDGQRIDGVAIRNPFASLPPA
jgi:predicted nucleic acid-binding protein